MFPTVFCVAFLVLCASRPGHSNEMDTLKCHEDKGTCHPMICPAQKMAKGTCYDGVQLCCVDCPESSLSDEGNGVFCRGGFGIRDSIKILHEKGVGKRDYYKTKGRSLKRPTPGSREDLEEENASL